MEEITENTESETSPKLRSKNGKGSSKSRDKKVSRKNSDISCKSKRKLKTFSFGKWQKGLNKEKNKKRTFNLDRETCRSSSSIVSESSIENVTCICTGYRKTKAIAEKNFKEEIAACSIEDLAIANPQTPLENVSSHENNANHRDPTFQDLPEAALDGHTQQLEQLRPSLPNINEINLTELTLALRNHLCLPEIPEQLVARYGDLSLAYQSSSLRRPHFLRPAHTQIDYIHHLVPGLLEITNCSFYWGKMDRYKAEKQLDKKPEGTFLLRDSAQEEYLFSVSFRRYGRTLHARIEQLNHKFSFDSYDPNVFAASTVCGLLEHYKNPRCCMFFEPMLTLPVHRTFPFSLQHICRSAVADCVTYDNINQLNLPKKIKSYLKEYHYKQKIRVRHLENDV